MQQCIKFYFILEWHFTCFGRSFRPSSGVQDCTYSNRCCCLLASKQRTVSFWQMPVAVCTVMNSWWWTERPSETCSVSFQNKIKFDTLLYLVGFTIEIIWRVLSSFRFFQLKFSFISNKKFYSPSYVTRDILITYHRYRDVVITLIRIWWTELTTNLSVLGTFAKLQSVTISFDMSLSVRPSGRTKFIFTKGPLTGTLSLLCCLNHLNKVSLTSLLSGVRNGFILDPFCSNRANSFGCVFTNILERRIYEPSSRHKLDSFFFSIFCFSCYFNFSFDAQNLPLMRDWAGLSFYQSIYLLQR